MYTKQQLADRFGVSPHTIDKYRKLGILPKTVPPVGPHAAYTIKHVEIMEGIWGWNGLKDSNRTLKDWAQHLNPVAE